MKKILVPTDFSDHARNAGFYAVELAKHFKSHLVLYHAYSVPAVLISPPVYSGHFPQGNRVQKEVVKMEGENLARLRFFRETILKGKKDPCCTVVQRRAFVNEGITDYAEENKTDLIVMGTRGSKHTGDMLIATATWGVIQKSRVPVLAIPEGYTYKPVNHICFATNLQANDLSLIESLIGYAKVFNAKLSIVHVCDQIKNLEEHHNFDYFSKEISSKINYENLDFRLLEHKDISVALAEYLKENKVDIIALSYEKRNVFEQLFHRSLTRMFALHAEIPLLAFTS